MSKKDKKIKELEEYIVDREYDYYLSWRNYLVDILGDNNKMLDNAILMLSSVGLFSSIIFLDQIGRPANSVMAVLLFTSWIYLVYSIIISLTSFRQAMKSVEWGLDKHDSDYLESIGEEHKVMYQKDGDKLENKVRMSNKTSYLFCILGLVLLVVYAIISKAIFFQ